MSFTTFFVRRVFRGGDHQRDAGLETPEDIERFDDIAYGPDAVWQALDVYRPRAAEKGKKLPVIVSVHGGGWVYGDKDGYQHYCMSLAQRGFAVVNFSYRLAPKHKFPAPLEDTCTVFDWVRENAEKYGFDTGNIYAVGDSAGANILGLYICLCTNEDYAPQFAFAPKDGLVPKAAAFNCGVYSARPTMPRDLLGRLMKDVMPKKGTPEEYAVINLSRHVTAAFPPCFVMTSTGDFLNAQAAPFAEKLQGLGVPCELHVYGDAENMLGHVFHCDVRSEDAAKCNDEECAFFQKYIS